MNTAIIGLQWGDEGKGKIVDFLADKFDAVVRFQGGHNAGHTIKVGDQIYKLSLLPSGIIRGKFSVIGSGVVVDPIALFSEIEKIEKAGIKISADSLAIADNCCLILSLHRELDQLLENKKGDKKIGTTGRGIGPTYEDRAGRRALRICDLLDEKTLQERLTNLLFYHNLLRQSLGAEIIAPQKIIDEIAPVREQLLAFAKPSFEIAKKLSACKAVMFEGAQGALLDVSYGTFPFVTSSNTMAGQIALGSCLGVDALHKTIGVLKAYTTRVGAGPFPTELHDETGNFLRIEGNEVGTVTGRDRRCGWFDAVLVRQAIQLCSVKEVALTKLDVLDKLTKIRICVGYQIDGKVYDYLPQANHLWAKIEPIYEEIDGWKQSTIGTKILTELPQKTRNYISRIEELCGVKVSIISTGAKREETILINEFAYGF
ncbi:MAG: adenylosuccinate synthase [Alphaproteobacteria bacterium RIFCSPLOWO2_01_FULL_40_26]|nr:MAG: adenylosuccinate synthase [Alphaproteobacteria bacterium RIFCSPHIGHO2_02_FULL_40_34]OFW85411.1 MAG: adenylosuccinate synthase [Alphaproteobacteria bacterium RIFCSPHIGHO2_01_FULL_40_8]OFW94118.1 MAG: adenylosuccinate synthase [Alphaproteobacteria bacterium RIFCSPLOWO2_01_FULL_40_26]OFX09703.1 MAG: adenylosuccinate synthase [Alphaproteobacteria bacterium RIFCSPLOWO2_02_FULL_40_19]OFX11383.1 MAG: adenylosuccinate synthase [Alphaproteobacteria bacterium RIFCSPLOWO2_12_FULL_40_11]